MGWASHQLQMLAPFCHESCARDGPRLQEIKRFGKPTNVTCVAVFGGSGVANQISELKRGTESVVCTPGRMIDLLTTSNGERRGGCGWVGGRGL